MMLLSSAETGEPVALLADEGHLTDVRTAAVAAMVARELGRRDTRRSASSARAFRRGCRRGCTPQVLPLEAHRASGAASPERAAECARDLAAICGTRSRSPRRRRTSLAERA